ARGEASRFLSDNPIRRQFLQIRDAATQRHVKRLPVEIIVQQRHSRNRRPTGGAGSEDKRGVDKSDRHLKPRPASLAPTLCLIQTLHRWTKTQSGKKSRAFSTSALSSFVSSCTTSKWWSRNDRGKSFFSTPDSTPNTTHFMGSTRASPCRIAPAFTRPFYQTRL